MTDISEMTQEQLSAVFTTLVNGDDDAAVMVWDYQDTDPDRDVLIRTDPHAVWTRRKNQAGVKWVETVGTHVMA